MLCFYTEHAVRRDRDEANDDVKSSILVAIGSWLKFTSTLPPSVSTRLAECLKEKDALKSAALKATLQVSFPDSAQCAAMQAKLLCQHRQHLLATQDYCYLRQQASDCFLSERLLSTHSMQTMYFITAIPSCL